MVNGINFLKMTLSVSFSVFLVACSDANSISPEITPTIQTPACIGIEEVPYAFCGYKEEPFEYDNSWSKNKLLYEGHFEYLDYDVFNGFNKEYFTQGDSLPIVKSRDCLKKYDNSDELLGYKSEDECVCEILNDEQYYYDINEAIKGIDINANFNYVYYPSGFPTDFGIAYKDTLFYKATNLGENIIPIPSCYRDLWFVGKNEFCQNPSQLLKKIVRNGERNMFLELFACETEDCFFLSVRLDGVLAYGYVIK